MCSSSPSSSSEQVKKNSEAEKALEDFKTILEIKWLIVDGNNAYVGWNPIPSDYRYSCNAMAKLANKATDFGFHVWAFDALKVDGNKQSVQNAINSNLFLYEITARHGKFE